MSAENYYLIFKICRIAAISIFILAIILFFVLKIYDVIRYYTGHSERVAKKYNKKVQMASKSSKVTSVTINEVKNNTSEIVPQKKAGTRALNQGATGTKPLVNPNMELNKVDERVPVLAAATGTKPLAFSSSSDTNNSISTGTVPLSQGSTKSITQPLPEKTLPENIIDEDNEEKLKLAIDTDITFMNSDMIL